MTVKSPAERRVARGSIMSNRLSRRKASLLYGPLDGSRNPCAVRILPMVPAKHVFAQVAAKVFDADAVVDSMQTTFQNRIERFAIVDSGLV